MKRAAPPIPSLPAMRAFVAEKGDDGVVRGVRDDFETGDLGEGDVLVQVAWSSVNYKDALATIAKGQVARISPLIPGIDLAGTAEDSGEEVLAHGYDLGVAHHGGYAEYARVPSEWIVPLPGGLSAAPGDGDRHRRLHRRALRDRARGRRPDARRGPGAGHGRQRRRRLDRGRHPRRARLRGRRLDRQGPGVPARRSAPPR